MTTARVDVAVIGAGFAGLALARRLREVGIDDVMILERGDALGGTWRDNTYPGAACDIPSHLYSLSFHPKHDWSRTYARQPEIRAYLEEVADAHDLRRLVRPGAEVAGATFTSVSRSPASPTSSASWVRTRASGTTRSC